MITHQDFASYYNEYFQDLYNYGKNITPHDTLVEDCIQETFLHFWQQREAISTIQSVKAYLLASLRRIIFRKLKQQKKWEWLSDDKEFIVEETVPDTDTSPINHQKLQEHLQLLSKRQREALYLLYYDNLDYEETAFVMGLATKSVYNLAYQAIQKLKATLYHPHLLILNLTLLLYFLLVY
jgi:RNA polymerase sigma factor (sigma-70 family)